MVAERGGYARSGNRRIAKTADCYRVCESNLLPGSWKDLLEHLAAHPQPPLMIVTSQLADDYLWVEALHLGAYDVLRKQFDPDELRRVMTLASLNWSSRSKSR